VPAVGLDHRVAIDARDEPRTERDDQRGIGDARVERALGHPPVDHGPRAQQVQRGSIGVDQHGNLARPGQRRRVLDRGRQLGRHAFDRRAPGVHRLGEGHRAPHGQRLGELGHDHRESAAHQAPGRARGQIARAADQDERVIG
jgi:hypothetical protein